MKKTTPLQERMAVALKARLMTETPEFSLRWKDWPMPAGVPIQGLRAGKKIATASTYSRSPTSWSTPTEDDANNRTRETGAYQSLMRTSQMSGWTTPQAHDASPPDATRWRRYGTEHGAANLNDEAAMVDLAGWATPNLPNGGRMPKGGAMSMTGQTPDGLKRQVDLNWQVNSLTGATRAISTWRTPTTRDSHPSSRANRTRNTPTIQLAHEAADLAALDSGTSGPSSDPTQKASIGALNPEFVSWLMGFPPEWLSSAPLATPSSRRSRSK